ncbi:MAG: DUF2691 family protein [Clostridium sp.]|nr:DUF2691 family protein [Clostridium sp.]
MIGLDIKVKNGYSNYLNKILDGINLFNYIWEINADDFLYSDNGEVKEDFFGADILNAEGFIRCISRDSYYMIFADIKAYPLGSERAEIETFKDFLRSSCVMVILCTDSSFIEFYCKDRRILDQVYNNCINSGFEKVEYKSADDVSERSLIAW